MPPNAQADFTDALRRHVHQSRVSEATDPSPLCGAPAHRSGGTRRPMGTPQQRYLPRTIASDRVDDAAPSVAQHERTLAQSAAHLVALAHGRRAPFPAIFAGERFRESADREAAEPRPDPPGAAGAARSKCVSSTRPHESSRAAKAEFGSFWRRISCRKEIPSSHTPSLAPGR